MYTVKLSGQAANMCKLLVCFLWTLTLVYWQCIEDER